MLPRTAIARALAALALVCCAACQTDGGLTRRPPASVAATEGGAQAGSLGKADSKPTGCALLIGIADYGNTDGVPNLFGPVNDVQLMVTLLRRRFDVDASHIQVLLDREATHTQIQAAFRRLSAYTPACGFVYIHFSGHGSEYRLENDDEPHPTWVTYGARSDRFKGLDRYDVRSTEIAQWLAPLPTRNIVFVSDSCHSQAASRGEPRGVRGVAMIVLPRTAVSLGERHIDVRSFGFWVGAAREDQTASEFDIRNQGPCRRNTDSCRGVFSWHWTRALSAARPGETWQDVFNRAAALVSADSTSAQIPQREGDGRLAVFDGRFEDTRPTVTVTAVTGNRVKIDHGSIAGVTAGSEYSARVTAPVGGNATPSVRIDEEDLGPFTASATLLSGSLAPMDLLVETRHAYAVAPIDVYLGGDVDDDADRAAVASLQHAIAELPDFLPVGHRGDAAWSIMFVREAADQRAAIGTPLPESLAGGHPAVWVVDAGGRLIHPALRVPLDDLDRGIATFKANLLTYQWSREVRLLGAKGGDLPIQLGVDIWQRDAACEGREDKDVSCAPPPFDARGQAYRRRGPYPAKSIDPPPGLDDVLVFSMANLDPGNDWNAYLIAIGPDAAVEPLFPTSIETAANAYFPRRTDDGTPAKSVAAYRLSDVGTEHFLLIASRSEVPVGSLAHPSMTVLARGDESLASLLGKLARRDRAAAGDVDSWHAAEISVDVKPR